jgi:hypothetical protein
MLSVIMLSVIMLSVMLPVWEHELPCIDLLVLTFSDQLLLKQKKSSLQNKLS